MLHCMQTSALHMLCAHRELPHTLVSLSGMGSPSSSLSVRSSCCAHGILSASLKPKECLLMKSLTCLGPLPSLGPLKAMLWMRTFWLTAA